MYQKEIEAYWNDPARERELVAAISRLVGVKSVKGEGPILCSSTALPYS